MHLIDTKLVDMWRKCRIQHGQLNAKHVIIDEYTLKVENDMEHIFTETIVGFFFVSSIKVNGRNFTWTQPEKLI